jgi:hypothetical protein
MNLKTASAMLTSVRLLGIGFVTSLMIVTSGAVEVGGGRALSVEASDAEHMVRKVVNNAAVEDQEGRTLSVEASGRVHAATGNMVRKVVSSAAVEETHGGRALNVESPGRFQDAENMVRKVVNKGAVVVRRGRGVDSSGRVQDAEHLVRKVMNTAASVEVRGGRAFDVEASGSFQSRDTMIRKVVNNAAVEPNVRTKLKRGETVEDSSAVESTVMANRVKYSRDARASTRGRWMTDALSVLGLSAGSGLVVVLVIMIGDKIGYCLSWSGKEAKLQELVEQQDAARAIEQAIEVAKVAAAQKAAQEAAALEAAAHGEEALVPPPEDGEPDFSHDELLGAVLVASEDGQRQISDVAETVKKQTDWVSRRVDVAKTTLDNEQQCIKERAEAFAMKEVTNLMHKLDMAMQAEGQSSVAETHRGLKGAAEKIRGDARGTVHTIKKMEGVDRLAKFFTGGAGAKETHLLDEIRPHPLSTMITGALAPTQLKMMQSSHEFNVLYCGMVLATALAFFFPHVITVCSEQYVRTWHSILIATNATMVLVSAIYRTWCASALEVIRSEQAKVKNVSAKVGHPLLDTFSDVQDGVTVFVKGAFLYNGIVSSWFHALKQLAFLVNTSNGGFGLAITIWKVREHESCARPQILFLHIYSLIFLICLSFTLLQFAYWLLTLCAKTRVVNDALLNVAFGLDAGLPGKLPLFSSLARAFLLTESAQVHRMKVDQAKSGVAELEEAVRSVNQKLAVTKKLREDSEKHRVAAKVMEADMMAKYKTKLATTLPNDDTPIS